MHASFTKTLAFFLLLFTAPITALADTTQLHSYLPEGCYHAGEYEQQKTLVGIDKPLVTQGSFAFNCNQGLIWHTQSPITETIIYKIQGEHFMLRADGSTQVLDSRVQRALGKLLTHLIGGNSGYLQETFTLIETENSVELTPKNKQMQKFLHSLSIAPQTDSVKITLQLAEQETIAIRIFSRRSFTNLEQPQCEQLANLPPQACALLFKGAR